jgi:hypothetical protein
MTDKAPTRPPPPPWPPVTFPVREGNLV